MHTRCTDVCISMCARWTQHVSDVLRCVQRYVHIATRMQVLIRTQPRVACPRSAVKSFANLFVILTLAVVVFGHVHSVAAHVYTPAYTCIYAIDVFIYVPKRMYESACTRS